MSSHANESEPSHDPARVRAAMRAFLRLPPPVGEVVTRVHEEVPADGYTRKTVSYVSDGEEVQAFLFQPSVPCALAAVVLHQHNSQWHIGKSEVAGLTGDPLQAFGPILAQGGVTVLAPDSVGFESRITRQPLGADAAALAPRLDPARGSSSRDWLQYYNHAMHRLARGELLMRKLLIDIAHALTVVQSFATPRRVGLIGHSHGGNQALFAAALDERVDFAVSSGAVCSYRHKFRHGIGLDMALVIPGFAERFDFDDLLRCVAPRELLVVSSDADELSADAEHLVERARATFARQGASERLVHLRTPGGHALDRARSDAIARWTLDRR